MKPITLRLDDDVYEELVTLASIYGVSRNALLNNLVRVEYDKYASDPKIKKTLEQLKELKSVLEKFEQ